MENLPFFLVITIKTDEFKILSLDKLVITTWTDYFFYWQCLLRYQYELSLFNDFWLSLQWTTTCICVYHYAVVHWKRSKRSLSSDGQENNWKYRLFVDYLVGWNGNIYWQSATAFSSQSTTIRA